MSVNLTEFKNSLTSLLKPVEGFIFDQYEKSPLFAIMQYKPNVVAFAELNGDAEISKEKSFNLFRSYFIEKQREWNSFDLSLVYCITSNNVSQELLNQIQLDPYFCKKYVINITNPDKLNDEFQSLPFVPLLSNEIILVNRPLPAKELLREYGVQTGIISGIVDRGRMAPQTIINKCLAEKESPVWSKIKSLEPKLDFVAEKEKIPTRLKSISINNFRAYKKGEFNLDADVIVLYGNNGLGKTSFFEAIDFACTGNVQRLEQKFDTSATLNAIRYNDSMKFLDCKNIQNSFIKLNLKTDSNVIEIERKLSDRSSSIYNSQTLSRKEMLQNILQSKDELMNMSTDNFVDLFRSSHIFGQDYSTLTPESFMKDSVLDENVISRMLSFQDYTQGIDKGDEVLVIIGRDLKREKDTVSQLNDDIINKTNEIKTYSKKFDNVYVTDDISKRIAELFNQLRSKIKSKFPQKITVEVITNIRTEIQIEIDTKNSRIRELKKALNKFDTFKNDTLKFEQTQKEIEKVIKLEKIENDNKINIEGTISKIEDDLESASKSEKEKLSALENIQWLRANYQEYVNIIANIEKEEKETKTLSVKLGELYKELEKAENQNEKAKIELGKSENDIEEIEKLISSYNELKSNLNDYRISNEKITELSAKKKSLIQQLDKLKDGFGSNNRKLNQANNNLGNVVEQIQNIQKNQEEYQSLLENLEKYVISKECPACGHEYDSKSQLLERFKLKINKKDNSIVNLSALRVDLSKQSKELTSIKKGHELQITDTESQLESLELEISGFRSRNQTIKQMAKKLELIIDESNSLTKINKYLDSLNTRKVVAKEEGKVHSNSINESDKLIRGTTLRIKEFENNINSRNSLIRKLQNQKLKFDNYASDYDLTFNIKFEKLKDTQNKISQDINRLKTEKEDSKKLLLDLRVKYDSVKGKISHLSKTIKLLRKALNDLDQIINEYKELRKKLEISKDTAKNQIEKLVDDLQVEIESLAKALKEINILEITLEAQQSSALAAKLKIEVQKLDSDKQKIEELCFKLEKLQSYFKKLVNVLKETRNKSIEDYIKNLGPLSFKIQQRLRSVYNFEEIKLQSINGKVHVKTYHGGYELSPTDYFSQSQIQILILSLFFSAALTQNWSSFSPILLDDPVTHFDDMNCYAFTDLIRGIVNSNNHCQFIISTCEERFYALMKQKFKKLNGKAIFYEFKTIGENGPVIEQLD